eukprot:602354_1
MGCSGKVICGILMGIIGIAAYIVAFGANEITRSNSAIGATWCGWDANGICGGLDCEDAFFLSQEDGSTYPVSLLGTHEEQCDGLLCVLAGDDCYACKNKLGGQIWIGGVATGVVMGVIGIICLFIPSARGCGGGTLAFAGFAGLVAMIGFLAVTMDDLACFDTSNENVTVAASTYCVGVGVVCLLVGGIASCGATRYE